MLMLMMLVGWLPWLLLGGAAIALGVRAVRALERRGGGDGELAALRDRVQTLEDAVASQDAELQRLADDQRFTQRLLLDRPPLPPPSRPDAPDSRPEP